MLAAILELEPGASHEVGDGAGYEDFARPGQRRHALSDVNCDSTDILAAKLHLTGVQSSAYFDAESADSRADRLCASHGAGRAVEGRQDAIAGRVHLATAMAVEFPRDEFVMAVEEVGHLLSPRRVA
jgi:hypothetical protein